MHPALWLLPLSFLSGSIPFGLLIGLAKGVDVRKSGSGNIGATNVGRILGRPYFFLCFALDFLKGAFPTLLFGGVLGILGSWNPSPEHLTIWLLSLVLSVLGHVFTPWLGFRGGKGVATSLGALMGVFPLLTVPAVVAFVVWGITLRLAGFMSVASIGAALSLPVTGLIMTLVNSTGFDRADALVVGMCAFLSALVLWTHRANIARLRAGTEPKFRSRQGRT